MLGFMAVSGLAGWLNIRGLSLSVRLPDELYAGLETLATVQIVNRRRLFPSFLVSATLSGETTSFLVLDPGAAQEGSLLVTFPERGLHRLADARISSPFPANFFVRFRSLPVPGLFPVFPAPRPSTLPVAGGKPEQGQLLDAAAKGYEGELAKISDYRGGESLKLIHWRLSAKHEVFKVKELTSTAEEPVLLEPELLPGRDLEERLSCCAFLINRLVKGGRPVGLKLGERIIAPAANRPHRLKLLGELAVYGKH